MLRFCIVVANCLVQVVKQAKFNKRLRISISHANANANVVSVCLLQRKLVRREFGNHKTHRATVLATKRGCNVTVDVVQNSATAGVGTTCMSVK